MCHKSCMEENVVDRDQVNKEGKEDDMIYVHITTRIIKEATARELTQKYRRRPVEKGNKIKNGLTTVVGSSTSADFSYHRIIPFRFERPLFWHIWRHRLRGNRSLYSGLTFQNTAAAATLNTSTPSAVCIFIVCCNKIYE